jgi:aminoglycoside phosphotransferase (APT) family kinase protein
VRSLGVIRLNGFMSTDIEITLGSSIARERVAPWGNKNRTVIADLADGRRVVIQHYPERGSADLRLLASRLVAESPHLGDAVSVPRVIARGEDWAAFNFLEGENAYIAAGQDLAGAAWLSIAHDMGRLAADFRTVPHSALPASPWDSADALRDHAETWLTHLRPHVPESVFSSARGVIRDAPHVPTSELVFAHGDFGPQNVMVQGGHVTGLLDFEDARRAHPLLDTAWWVWLVRTHTPNAFETGWPAFQEGQGHRLDANDPKLHSLMTLKLLETADAFRRTAPTKYPSWGQRLTSLLEM